MHADEQALVRTICEQPDDDTPRLVYADWLQENAREDRAEFIRVQIERSRLDEYDPRYAELVSRENELLKLHEREWISPIPMNSRAAFQRGFVNEIRPLLNGWLHWRKRVVARHPISRLFLDRSQGGLTGAEEWERFCRMPELSGISYLSPGVDFNLPSFAERLAETTQLTRLRGLELVGQWITQRPLRELTRWPCAASIRELDLHSFRLEGVRWPSALERWVRLSRLHMTNMRMGTTHAREISEMAWMELTDFSAVSQQLDALSPAILGTAPWWPQLELLNLEHNPLTDQGIAHLADSSLLGIRQLFLRGTRMTTIGAIALSKAPWLSQLRRLHLDDPIGDEGLLAILASLRGTQLRELDVAFTGITQFGLAGIADCPALSQLVKLDIRDCDADRPTIRRLIRSPYLQNLRYLTITYSGVFDKMFAELNERFDIGLLTDF